MEPLIHCDNLVKIYKTTDIEVMALQGLDFDVNEGELIAIIGKSGSGKSTLLNILGGLEKPTAGYITFDGDMISEIPEKKLCAIRSNKIGYVWQKNTDNLLQYLTAVQNVEMPLMFSNISKKEREQMAKEALDKVGLSEKYYSFPTAMSGGEQQRVAIATAIVNKNGIAPTVRENHGQVTGIIVRGDNMLKGDKVSLRKAFLPSARHNPLSHSEFS